MASGNTEMRLKPIRPIVVLIAAILLPGSGQVLNRQPGRGFTMQMFIIALAIVTWQLAEPDRSVIGKLSGGFFIYAMSILDAYKFAKLRWLTARPELK